MIVLLIVVAAVLLLVILIRTSEQKESIRSLTQEIRHLSEQVSLLAKQQDTSQEQIKKTPVTEKPIFSAPPVIKPQEIKIPEKPEEKEAIHTVEKPRETFVAPKPVSTENADAQLLSEVPKQSATKSRDLEKFIGENLANKIGIAVLVLGISFFIKYAIDKNWINEVGRVLIGFASGAILIGIAHYVRKSYRSFSSVLVGGGLTVFYFSVAFAFHQYHLISQPMAFAAMSAITIFAIVLSLSYDRQELAILAILGGFVTPFLVSTGNDNYVALFTYLCILNAGMMVLAWFKRWPAINIITLVFTTIIYGGWLMNRLFFTSKPIPVGAAFCFATIFYLLFITMNVINNLRLKKKFNAFDFIIVLSVNFLYYAAGFAILSEGNGSDFKGAFTALLGIFNVGLVILFYKKQTIDRNFVSLLIGLSITFVSLVAPVEFKGNHIVLFWGAESVILLWLYRRTGITHLYIASRLIAVLMAVSLFITWNSVYFFSNDIIPIVLNKGFVTGIVSAIALFIYYRLMPGEELTTKPTIYSHGSLRDVVLTASIVTAYLAGALEIFYQFGTRHADTLIYAVYLQAYSFAVAILILKVFRRSAYFPVLKFLLTTLCFLIYLINLNTNAEVSFALMQSGKGSLFIGHWVAAVLLGWLLYDVIVFFFKDEKSRWAEYRTPFTWVAAAGIVLLLSVEMYHVILWTNFKNPQDWLWWENLYYKAGLTILWGICSFVMIWLGMRFSFRTLRVISLSLFTVTILKLFLYDIRRVPPGGKIAAFILLGVLLLTVSFMYQRLKRIIIDKSAGE